MRFAADCSFQIGAQHLRSGLPCQDYAVAGTVDTRAYAIVSDGCSSGGRTDVGARLIALHEEGAVVNMMTSRTVLELGRLLGLGQQDCLATIVKAVATRSGFHARVQGDGVIALRQSGVLTFKKFEWLNNAPCYPVYEADDFFAFMEMQGGPSVPAFETELWRSYYDGGIPSGYRLLDARVMTVSEGLYGSVMTNYSDLAPGDTVAVFSDGVLHVDGMEWQDVVRHLMSFKTTEGDFVKRRLNRFISTEAKAKGRGPLDDIAMAAIVIQE